MDKTSERCDVESVEMQNSRTGRQWGEMSSVIRELSATVGIALVLTACGTGNDNKTPERSTIRSATTVVTTTATTPSTVAEVPVATSDAATEPTVVECLPGTPGPARWSDGSTRFSQWCYDNNGGAAYASAEGNAGLPPSNANTSSIAPGDDCTDSNATTVDSSGRTLYCNPTVNGRNAGNLVWQLQP